MRSELAFQRKTPRPWLIPTLLLLLTLFLSGTFRTSTVSLMSFALTGLLVIVIALWNQRRVFRAKDGAAIEGWRLVRHSGPFRFRYVWLLQLLFLIAAFIAAIAWRSRDYMGPNFNPIAMAVDASAHGALFASMVFWFFHPYRGHPFMLAFGLAVVMLSIAAGGISQSLTSQTAAALATFIAFCYASRWILALWPSKLRMRSSKKRARRRALMRPGEASLGESHVTANSEQGRLGLLFSVLSLTVIMMSTSAIAHVTSGWLPFLQSSLYNQLQSTLESTSMRNIAGGGGYVRGSRLGSIRNHMTSNPNETALRAFADSPPGYLKGTAFDVYSGGKWEISHDMGNRRFAQDQSIQSRRIQSTGRGLTRLSNAFEQRQLRHFPINDRQIASAGQVEIRNVPGKGYVFFTPLSYQWMEASSRGNDLIVNQHGVVEGGVLASTGYVVDVAIDVLPEELSPLRKEILLSVPPELGKVVGPLTRGVTRGRLTAQSKARAIEEYFEDNYEYSTQGIPVVPTGDPITHFLETQHAAHCEYFASASVMMLRSVGVPARYVTGYVVWEYNQDEEAWVAKNRDAHAWVEAYDEISERWFPVESTVGRRYQTLSIDGEELGTDSSWIQNLDAEEEELSVFVRAMGWLATLRATDPLIILFRFATVPLFLTVIALIWMRHRGHQGALLDPLEIQCRKMLHRMDRKLKRRGLIRSPNETLHQFARRVETASGNDPEQTEQLRQAATWYREFANERYQGRMPREIDFSLA